MTSEQIAERALGEIRLELYREQDNGRDCDIIMTLDLCYALLKVANNWIYYHGFDKPLTMFGRNIVTVHLPGYSYWISRERRLSTESDGEAVGQD